MNADDATPGDDRVPCADDLCVGTLDAAGVCTYCGRTASGAAVASGPAVPQSALASEDDLGSERIPCGDDLCTGTINERGVCNYCGKAAG